MIVDGRDTGDVLMRESLPVSWKSGRAASRRGEALVREVGGKQFEDGKILTLHPIKHGRRILSCWAHQADFIGGPHARGIGRD